MMVHYGGPPDPFDRQKEWQKRVEELWPEAIVRDIRELKEKIEALEKGASGTGDSLEVVRKVVRALIESHPDALTVIEDVCAEVKK